MMGTAALAMWWDVSPDVRDEFEHWHTHEHFPERLSLPGFERASRWGDADAGDGFFVLYELAGYEALVSPEYLARLNAPTAWSRAMMPHHRHMVRSPARVLASRGGAVAGHALTLRFSPGAVDADRLLRGFESLVIELPAKPGMCGAHLLQTDVPAVQATTEEKIRGLSDRRADWIFLATGYDEQSLHRATQDATALMPAANGPALVNRHRLRLSMAKSETATASGMGA